VTQTSDGSYVWSIGKARCQKFPSFLRTKITFISTLLLVGMLLPSCSVNHTMSPHREFWESLQLESHFLSHYFVSCSS